MLSILDKVPSPPSWFTTLLIDAMYFHAAKKFCEDAKGALKGIGKARKAFAELRSEESEILEHHDGDAWEAYDELEPIYIQMENREYNIGAAYGPYFQNIALTHILCATAAEAHINIIAKGRLRGKLRDNFEKISLVHRIENITSNTGKIEFPHIQTISYKIMGKCSQKDHYCLDNKIS